MMYQENQRFPDIMSEIAIALADIFGQPDVIRRNPETQLFTLNEFTAFFEGANSGKTVRQATKADMVEFIKKMYKAIDTLLGLISVGQNQSQGECLECYINFVRENEFLKSC